MLALPDNMKMPKGVLVLYIVDFTLVFLFALNVKFHFDQVFGTYRQIGSYANYISRTLDLEGEGWLPTWYSSVQLLLVAQMLTVFVAARSNRREPASWSLWALPFVFLLLSYDEVGQVHEYAGYLSDYLLPNRDRAAIGFGYSGLWGILIGFPGVCFILFLVWRARRYFHGCGQPLARFAAGAVILFAGAAVLDEVANLIMGTRWMVYEVMAEELLEMVGVTTMVWACWELLRETNAGRALAEAFGTDIRDGADGPTRS